MWATIPESLITGRIQPPAQVLLGRPIKIIYSRGQRKNFYKEKKCQGPPRNLNTIEKMHLNMPRSFCYPRPASPGGCGIISPCRRRLRKRKLRMEDRMDRTPDSYKSRISHQSHRDRSPRVPQLQRFKRRKTEWVISTFLSHMDR